MKGFLNLISKAKRIYKKLGKREKFVLIATLESILFFLTLSIANSFLILFLLSTAIVVLTTFFCLREELSGIKYFILLILPISFWGSGVFFVRTIAENGLFYFFSAILYGVSRYSLLLTLNIYNVAAIRTIQLIRAAHAVGLLFTLVSSFFIFCLVWSMRPAGWTLALLVAIFSFPLIFQSLWSAELENFISKRIIVFSLVLTLALTELALSFSFWPLLPTIGSLALVSAMYVLLSLSHFHFSQRLNKKTIWEYLGIAVIILFFIIVTTRWGE